MCLRRAQETGTWFVMEDDNDDNDNKSEDDDRGHDVYVGDEDGGVHLLGSTTEFKMDGENWPQMFANMARITNLLVV